LCGISNLIIQAKPNVDDVQGEEQQRQQQQYKQEEEEKQ
jgi:hypothetical protein